MKTPIITALILFLVSVSSCKKNSESDPAPSEKTKLLTAKPWKLSSAIEDGNDVMSNIDCSNDNLYIYSLEGNYTVDEGETKCLPSDPQTIFALEWEFIDDETKIKYSDASTANIIELNSTKLQIHFPPQLYITYTNQ